MEPLLTFDSLKSRFSRTYYYVNLFSCLIIPILRILHRFPFSTVSYHNFQIEWKIVIVVVLLVIMKTFRATSLEESFGVFFLYAKLTSMAISYFSSSSWVFPVLYIVFCLAVFVLLPQPPYYGPGEVIPLNKEALDVFLEPSSKAKGDSNAPAVRILLLDALWSTRCLNFQPVVASLSLKYTTENIKFGRIDLDEDPDYETRFRVDVSATSLQLPTILLFVDGTEAKRLPDARSDSRKNSLSMWDRSEASVVKAFNLNQWYEKSSSDLD